MDLLLIRHAEPIRIAAGEVDGPADPGLTARGTDQAHRLADWLHTEHVDEIIASPLLRARETAAPLARALGLDVVIDEGVSEYDADSAEYIPIEELRALKDDRWQATIEGRWDDAGGVDPAVFQKVVVPAIDGNECGGDRADVRQLKAGHPRPHVRPVSRAVLQNVVQPVVVELVADGGSHFGKDAHVVARVVERFDAAFPNLQKWI